MAITAFTGLSGLSGIYGSSGPLAPPNATDLIVYYEASRGTLDATDVAADNFEKIKTWEDIAPVGDAHNLVQATAGNQLRVRKTTDIPLIFSNFDEESATLAMTATGLDSDNREIDQRNSTFFALIELDILKVNSIASERVIMSLPGSVGDLIAYTATGETASAVLRWRDASGTTTTTIRLQSGLSLVGVILDAGEIRLFYNGQSHTIATPLAAGTATSFTLFDGSVGTCIVGGFNCVGWADHAYDSTELADLRTWAIVRKALSAPTRDVIMLGASIGLGVGPISGNLTAGRRYAIVRGDCSYRNFSFAGMGAAWIYSAARGSCVGWPYPQPANTAGSTHNTSNMQLVIVHSPTNDITNGIALATIVTNATDTRKVLRAYGYQVIWIGMAPVGGWDATQETKRTDFNAAMAALEEREYGIYIPYPAEMTDPTDTTYYDADQVHWAQAAYDLVYDDIKITADSLITVTPTALQTHMKFDGNYQDSSIYKRDWEAVGTPTFGSGAFGRQCLTTAPSGHYARGKNVHREFDSAGILWSCMFLMKSTQTGVWYPFNKYTGAGGTWTFERHSGGTMRIITNGLATLISSSTYYIDGNWHCIAMSVDADGARLYSSPDQYPANLTLQATVLGTPVITSTANRYRVGVITTNDSSLTSYAASFQDVMTFFGSKTLAEFQAISLA